METKIRKEIDNNAAASVIVNAGIDYLAATSPPVGALVAAYNIAQNAAEIDKLVQKTLDEYNNTRDVNRAAEVAVSGATQMVADSIKSKAIDTLADGLVSTAIPLTKGNEYQSQLMKSVVKAIFEEGLDESKKH